MRGSRLQKTLQISAITIVIAAIGVLAFYRYDQDSRSYLQYQHCQNLIVLHVAAQKLEIFAPVLAENVYLEETFDQKILPQLKSALQQKIEPVKSDRATKDDGFTKRLRQDQADFGGAKSVLDILKLSQEKAQKCERHTYVKGFFPAKLLPIYYPEQHSFEKELQQWQQTLVELKPLAVEVKKQIESDFHTLCQGWRNLAQAQQISRYFQTQCQSPLTKKKCSAEQNVKLKQYAGELDEQFQLNLSKFKKKWTKISLNNEEMKKKCL